MSILSVARRLVWSKCRYRPYATGAGNVGSPGLEEEAEGAGIVTVGAGDVAVRALRKGVPGVGLLKNGHGGMFTFTLTMYLETKFVLVEWEESEES